MLQTAKKCQICNFYIVLSTYLYQFVNTQGLIQLSQFTLIGPTEEVDKLLDQSFFIISGFRYVWWTKHIIQSAGYTLPTHTDSHVVNTFQSVLKLSDMKWELSHTYSCGDARGACKGVPRASKDKVSDRARGWNWESPTSILVNPELYL